VCRCCLPKIIKICRCLSKLLLAKVGAFFETQCKLGLVWFWPLDRLTPKWTVITTLPVDHPCKLASRSVHSYSNYRVQKFHNRQTNGRIENMMPLWSTSRTGWEHHASVIYQSGRIENMMPLWSTSLDWLRASRLCDLPVWTDWEHDASVIYQPGLVENITPLWSTSLDGLRTWCLCDLPAWTGWEHHASVIYQSGRIENMMPLWSTSLNWLRTSRLCDLTVWTGWEHDASVIYQPG